MYRNYYCLLNAKTVFFGCLPLSDAYVVFAPSHEDNIKNSRTSPEGVPGCRLKHVTAVTLSLLLVCSEKIFY